MVRAGLATPKHRNLKPVVKLATKGNHHMNSIIPNYTPLVLRVVYRDAPREDQIDYYPVVAFERREPSELLPVLANVYSLEKDTSEDFTLHYPYGTRLDDADDVRLVAGTIDSVRARDDAH
jgi:hypothetical protein